MSVVVPTIRAGSLAPILRWMVENGRPIEKALREAALGEQIAENPDMPVPIYNAIEFLRRLAHVEGPDIGCRVALGIDLREIGVLGAVARARPTPRQALHVAAATMPYHCSHERFAVRNTEDGVEVVESWTIKLDAEALHLVQQYVAALIQALCAATGAAAPLLGRVELAPHPTVGVAHLRPWLGEVEPAKGPRLLIEIPARVADARLSPANGEDVRPPPDWRALRGEGDFIQSVQWTIAAMLGPGPVSVDAVASAAGMTRRTLQRRLSEKNLRFSDLLDGSRRDAALGLLTSGALPFGEVAARLGYANASALTRAVRRWTGETPRRLRNKTVSGCQRRIVARGDGGAQR